MYELFGLKVTLCHDIQVDKTVGDKPDEFSNVGRVGKRLLKQKKTELKEQTTLIAVPLMVKKSLSMHWNIR